jgi:hypothetical protein
LDWCRDGKAVLCERLQQSGRQFERRKISIQDLSPYLAC